MAPITDLAAPADLLAGSEFDWRYDYDTDHAAVEREDALVVVLLDGCSGEALASLGGITVASLQISDHGNVNVSPEDEAYLRQIASDLAAEQLAGSAS